MLEFERDFAFRIDDLDGLCRDELRERVMTRVRRAVHSGSYAANL